MRIVGDPAEPVWQDRSSGVVVCSEASDAFEALPLENLGKYVLDQTAGVRNI